MKIRTRQCARGLAAAISLAWAAGATGAPSASPGGPAGVPDDAAIRAAKHAVTAYRDDVGRSEHEFITSKQLLLNLEMYTAVMAELAK